MKHYFFFSVIFFFFFLYCPAQQCIYINEIMVNTTGSNDGVAGNSSEWTELYNACCDTLDIGCYRLSDGDWLVIIPAGTKIPPFSFYTIGSSATYSGTPDLNTSTCNCISGSKQGVYTNPNDQAVLFDPSGNVVDAVMWGSGQARNQQTASAPGCGAITVTLPDNAAAYETTAGASIDGGTLARAEDGGSTWVQKNAASATFGTSNNNSQKPALQIIRPLVPEACFGENIKISVNASGPGSVSWKLLNANGATGSSFQVAGASVSLHTGAAAGYDTLVVSKNAGQCELRDTAVVRVRSCKCPEITAPAARMFICPGDSVELVSDLPAEWRLLNGKTSTLFAFEDSFFRKYAGPAADTLLLTDGAGCFDTVFVTVRDFPSASFVRDTFQICFGDTLRLEPVLTSGAEIRWNPATDISCNACVAPEAFPLSTTRYFLELTDSLAACVAKDSVTVEVLLLPEIDISAEDTVVCKGSRLFLDFFSAHAALTWWSGGKGTHTSQETDTNTYYVVSGDPESFYLYARAENRCGTVLDSLLVQLLEPPLAVAGEDIWACAADTVLLFGISAHAVQRGWSDNGGGTFFSSLSDTSAYLAPASADSLLLFFTVANACGVAEDTLLYRTVPALRVDAGRDIHICGRDSVLLLGSVLNGTAEWSGGNGVFSKNNEDTAYYVASAADLPVFPLVLKGTGFCGSLYDTLLVERLEMPRVEAGPGDTLCHLLRKNLEGSAWAADAVLWHSSAPGIIDMPRLPATIYIPEETENKTYAFYLTATNRCGSSVDSVLVHYIPPPDAAVSITDTILCEGDNPALLSPVQPGGLFNGSYLENGMFFTEKAGEYAIRYRIEKAGCTGEKVRHIQVLSNPSAAFSMELEPMGIFGQGDQVSVKYTGSGATGWLWDFGDHSGLETGPEAVHQYTREGSFPVMLIVSNEEGCADTSIRMLETGMGEEVYIPNAFTPNMDGKNEGFGIYGKGIERIQMRIYSRWGELLYTAENPDQTWNGTYRDALCPAGVYAYIIYVWRPNGKKYLYSGNVTLLR
jgi:gliding motility-associated-like protein